MRLIRASGQAARSPERELTGPQRAVQDSACGRKTALTHRLFFSGRSWGYINNRSPHAQFLSTYRSVRLHGKLSIIFFERKLDGNAPISVRVIALVSLTVERPFRLQGTHVIPILFGRNPQSMFAFIREGFNHWGGWGYDDYVPGEVTKTAPSGDETT